jgi:competence protein ComEC
LIAVVVWLAVFSFPDNRLHLIACDVGQGDAILAIYGKIQILTDAGPNNKVLDCLGKYLPFWDREIEVVILTHPDKDHYGGLLEVFKRYKIDNFLSNEKSVYTEAPEVGALGAEVLEKETGGMKIVGAGAKIRAGKIQLDILHPLEGSKSSDDNFFSLISLLSYGSFKALLTGDMPTEVSDQLAARQPIGTVNYLKVPHHGSKNNISENLLRTIMPKLAVISVGKNSYGHPAEETLKLLSNYATKILRTDQMGDIEVISDGEKYWVKK